MKGNHLAAWMFIGLAVNLGWFWRIADEHGWFVWPLGFAAMFVLIGKLRRYLDRADGSDLQETYPGSGIYE